MLNNNQIAESFTILALSAASVFTPLYSLFEDRDDGPNESHAFVMIEPENLPEPPTLTIVTKGTSLSMVGPVDSWMEPTEDPSMNIVEFDHEVGGDHPRHTEWCEVSRMIQSNP